MNKESSFLEVTMKKISLWMTSALLACLLAGCYLFSTPEPPEDLPVIIITVVVTATPPSNIIATAPLPTKKVIPTEPPLIPTEPILPVKTITPTTTSTPEPSPIPTQPVVKGKGKQKPTLLPDYQPGSGGIAVLVGEPPFNLDILPGGWQAYKIGSSATKSGYLVDINPHGGAPKGAYIESKILPEYAGGEWVDVLWLRAPGIIDRLPVTINLIPTDGWKMTWQDHVRLTAEWTGWSMFDHSEGCGGVLDISPDAVDQSGHAAYIFNYRVQPEGGNPWVEIARVQLSPFATPQFAWLRYYLPGPLAKEVLRKKTTLEPGQFYSFVVAPSYINQGYVFELIPLTTRGNEVSYSEVLPESDGEVWNDVLRVYVNEGQITMDALLRVLAVSGE
jgi:hypothetical protein